jgi:hypothetical protein
MLDEFGGGRRHLTSYRRRYGRRGLGCRNRLLLCRTTGQKQAKYQPGFSHAPLFSLCLCPLVDGNLGYTSSGVHFMCCGANPSSWRTTASPMATRGDCCFSPAHRPILILFAGSLSVALAVRIEDSLRPLAAMLRLRRPQPTRRDRESCRDEEATKSRTNAAISSAAVSKAK